LKDIIASLMAIAVMLYGLSYMLGGPTLANKVARAIFRHTVERPARWLWRTSWRQINRGLRWVWTHGIANPVGQLRRWSWNQIQAAWRRRHLPPP